MLLEVMAQVQEGRTKDLALAKKKCDQQPANSPIAIKEGVNRLKLGMGKRAKDEHRHRRGLVQEKFKLPERIVHLRDGWRDEGRLRKSAAARANLVLRSPKLAGFQMPTPHTTHEMELTTAIELKVFRGEGTPEQASAI